MSNYRPFGCRRNGLSDLFSTGKTVQTIQTTQFTEHVLVEVEEDPFGPPRLIGVLFVSTSLLSLEVQLGGYPYDPDKECYENSYITVITGPNSIRVVKEDN